MLNYKNIAAVLLCWLSVSFCLLDAPVNVKDVASNFESDKKLNSQHPQPSTSALQQGSKPTGAVQSMIKTFGGGVAFGSNKSKFLLDPNIDTSAKNRDDELKSYRRRAKKLFPRQQALDAANLQKESSILQRRYQEQWGLSDKEVDKLARLRFSYSAAMNMKPKTLIDTMRENPNLSDNAIVIKARDADRWRQAQVEYMRDQEKKRSQQPEIVDHKSKNIANEILALDMQRAQRLFPEQQQRDQLNEQNASVSADQALTAQEQAMQLDRARAKQMQEKQQELDQLNAAADQEWQKVKAREAQKQADNDAWLQSMGQE